jgi:hypothetical protein
MINRRELFTWWRRSVAPPARPARDAAPPLARVVGPTRIDDPEPFSLEAFYAARAKPRDEP